MAKGFDWGDYEDTVASAPQAPTQDFFAQFDDSGPTSGGSLPPQILDERNPDISWYDRTVAKNFANSPESQLKYLQQEYPGLEIALMGGEVVARRPGEVQYTKLDPSSFEFSDITDMGDVVTGGVAGQLGTVGGAIAGAAAGAPTLIGAVPGGIAGAAAGSAAASAGHEALRQYIGQKLGIPQEVSGGDVAMSGAFGAAGPLVFGTGPLKGMAANGETQGLIRAAWNKGIPKLASSMGGVTDDALKLYTNPATREQVDALASGGRTDFTDNLVSRVTGALNKEKQDIGQQLATAIDGAGENVNLKGAKQAFRTQIAQAKALYRKMPTPENKAAVDAAEQSYMSLFKDLKRSGQEIVIPGTPQSEIAAHNKAVAEYQQNIANFMKQDADYRAAIGQAGDEYAQPILPGMVDDLQRTGNVREAVELNGQNAAQMMPAPYEANQQELFMFDTPGLPRQFKSNEIQKIINRTDLPKTIRAQDNEAAAAFKQEMFDMGQQGDIVGTELVPRTYGEAVMPRTMNATGQTEMVFAPMARPQAPAPLAIIPDRTVVRDNVIPDSLKPSFAWKLQQQLKDYGDLRKISGGVNPRYASQATSSEKAMADSALNAYRSIGGELDRVTAGVSPKLKTQYAELADIQDALRPLNGQTQSAYSAFNNMDGSGKMAFREALEKLGSRTGENFAGDVSMLQAADHFGSKSWMPRSMKGTTSTSKTLTGGGAGAGLGFLFGGYPGMVIGGMAGSVASSPQAMKYGIKMTDPIRSGANAMGRVYAPMTPVIREGITKSPWDEL
ncbi:MAG: hypothetical protein KF767_08795 [Bdellovibrionaceae bacterium]|nr:hypothetical protein [Pseudobdellovibrionaceae bacterium]